MLAYETDMQRASLRASDSSLRQSCEELRHRVLVLEEEVEAQRAANVTLVEKNALLVRSMEDLTLELEAEAHRSALKDEMIDLLVRHLG